MNLATKISERESLFFGTSFRERYGTGVISGSGIVNARDYILDSSSLTSATTILGSGYGTYDSISSYATSSELDRLRTRISSLESDIQRLVGQNTQLGSELSTIRAMVASNR